MRLFRTAVEVWVPDSQRQVAELLEETLAGYQVRVRVLDGGRVSADSELVAPSVAQAAHMAVGVVRQVTGVEPDACHVVPEVGLVRRHEGAPVLVETAPVPDLTA